MSFAFAKKSVNTLGRRPKALVAVLVLPALALAAAAWYVFVLRQPKLPHRFVAGERLIYHLEYTSASASNLGALADDAAKELANTIYTSLESKLVTTV